MPTRALIIGALLLGLPIVGHTQGPDLGLKPYVAEPDSTRVHMPALERAERNSHQLKAFQDSRDPHVHYINEERGVIKAFRAKHKEIIVSEDWLAVVPKNLDEFRCINPESMPILAFLEYPKALAMFPYTEDSGYKPIRLVKISHKQNCENYYVYLQQKIDKKWVYKYNKQPLGIYQADKERFVTYLTEDNIDRLLESAASKGQVKTRKDFTPSIAVHFEETVGYDQMAQEYEKHFELVEEHTSLAFLREREEVQKGNMDRIEPRSPSLQPLVSSVLDRALVKHTNPALSQSFESFEDISDAETSVSGAAKSDKASAGKNKRFKLKIFNKKGELATETLLPSRDELTPEQTDELISELEAYINGALR